MKYLLVYTDGDIYQTDELDEDDVKNIEDGDVSVFYFEGGEFKEYPGCPVPVR